MAVGSVQPLKMITRSISWGKGGRCLDLTTLPPICADWLEFLGASNLLQSLGPIQACIGIAKGSDIIIYIDQHVQTVLNL